MEPRAMTVEQIIEQVMALGNEEREDLLSALRTRICFSCGCDEPLHGWCQCDNDE